jgi:hypothetical protein
MRPQIACVCKDPYVQNWALAALWTGGSWLAFAAACGIRHVGVPPKVPSAARAAGRGPLQAVRSRGALVRVTRGGGREPRGALEARRAQPTALGRGGILASPVPSQTYTRALVRGHACVLSVPPRWAVQAHTRGTVATRWTQLCSGIRRAGFTAVPLEALACTARGGQARCRSEATCSWCQSGAHPQRRALPLFNCTEKECRTTNQSPHQLGMVPHTPRWR